MAFSDERFTQPPRRDWHTVEVVEIIGAKYTPDWPELGRIVVRIDGKRKDFSRFPLRTGFGGIALAVGYMATRYIGRVN